MHRKRKNNKHFLNKKSEVKYFGFFIWVKERKDEERSIVEARPPMVADTAQEKGAGSVNRKQINEVERSEDAVKYLGRMSGQRVTMLRKEKMLPDACFYFVLIRVNSHTK